MDRKLTASRLRVSAGFAPDFPRVDDWVSAAILPATDWGDADAWLYGHHPNEYDRIVIPERVWPGQGDVRHVYLGQTQAKGTYQFNTQTMKAMGRMLSQTRRGQRVHYVFGKEVNPRLQHLRDGLDGKGV